MTTGAGAAQTVSVAQSGNIGGFTLTSSTCAGVAGVSAAHGSGPFTFTPLGAGSCNYTITGANGRTATISITVTTTIIISS